MRDVTETARPARRHPRRRLAHLSAAALAAGALAVGGGAAGAAAQAATTTAATASQAASATRAIAAAYTPPKRNLAIGMKGADVKALQQRLLALKYWPGKADGAFGGDTEAAVWAFQEINGIHVSGVVDAKTKRALVHPRGYKSASYSGKRATRIEVDQALEVLVYYKSGKVWFISHVSSGGGYYYNCGSYGCSRAQTPNGTYNTLSYLPGWVTVPLGAMFNPVFFIGREYAIHGDTSVPQGPASHGCVRVPMDVAAFFHKMIKTPGTQVHVYGTPQWAK